MAPQRRTLVLALAAVYLPTLACAGDYATPAPLPGDPDAAASSSDGGLPTVDAAPEAAVDAEPRDAEGDGNRCAPTPPACLSNATYDCVNPCRVTYNQCKSVCPNDANLKTCIDACGARLATCQVPCTGDCSACANANGSCTGSQDCAAIVFKG